jgi:hypothetical protein
MARESRYLSRGMTEIAAAGTLFVPHHSASDLFGVIDLGVGRLITDGNEVGVETVLFLQSGVQDVFLSGAYRYHFSTKGRRLFPFVGASAGVNILSDRGSSWSNFLARGELGVRYFLAQHVTMNIAYNLFYVRVAGGTFKDSTMSVGTVGLSYVF